jgi:hypothetical protein
LQSGIKPFKHLSFLPHAQGIKAERTGALHDFLRTRYGLYGLKRPYALWIKRCQIKPERRAYNSSRSYFKEAYQEKLR